MIKSKTIWRITPNFSVHLHDIGPGSCLVTDKFPRKLLLSLSTTSDPDSHPSACLINPANRSLCGAALPYFPIGGPVPQRPPPGLTNSVSGWGGLSAGEKMLYPSQTIDGVVHSLGGSKLKHALIQAASAKHAAAKSTPLESRHLPYGEDHDANELLPIGSAVVTGTEDCERLFQTGYTAIAHTPPPIYPQQTRGKNDLSAELDLWWFDKLTSCYIESITCLVHWNTTRRHRRSFFKDLLSSNVPSSNSLAIFTPLLGAGARGAPIKEAALAAGNGARHCPQFDQKVILHVCLRGNLDYDTVAEVFRQEFGS